MLFTLLSKTPVPSGYLAGRTFSLTEEEPLTGTGRRGTMHCESLSLWLGIHCSSAPYASASNSSLVRPIALTVSSATGAVVKNVKVTNGPNWAILINESKNVTFDGITISAKSSNSNPAKNTDGWDLYRSDQIVLKNSVVNNGDDCVSFKPSEHIFRFRITWVFMIF